MPKCLIQLLFKTYLKNAKLSSPVQQIMLYWTMLNRLNTLDVCLSGKGLFSKIDLSQTIFVDFQKLLNVTQKLLPRMSVCLDVRTYPCLTKCIILMIKGLNPYIGLFTHNYFSHF